MNESRIDSFWVNKYFGCAIEDLHSDENIVCPHKFLCGSAGAFIMKFNSKYILSVPPEYVTLFKHIAEQEKDLFDEDFLRHTLCDFNITYIGPSWMGYHSENIVHHGESRFLNYKNTKDYKDIEEFSKSCDPTEWSHSGINEYSELITAKYEQNIIVSASDYHLWDTDIAHIGIITHPLYRQKGYAKEVLNDITDAITAKGLIAQYRTLCSNESAVKTAEACGYHLYAIHIFLRLQRRE